ncbi:hypothetical protein, partial [Streptomyces anulatus]|uniref:hypothetical protein n=1 Tax=Streptomyces anulatus TaxID=1892 RepID=UPI003416D8F6
LAPVAAGGEDAAGAQQGAEEAGDLVAHLLSAMGAMQELTRTHVEKGEKALTPQVYWWCPGAYEQLPEHVAFASGQVPDLRPVGIEVNRQEMSVTPYTADTEKLITIWSRDHA